MPFSIVVATMFGAFVGSFLNVCVHRMPRNESVVHPPSRCYGCGARVRWYDNIPVLSWLILKGRCRWCGSTFSVRYLVVELAVAATSGLAIWAVQSGRLPPSPWLMAAGMPEWIAQAIAGGSLLLLAWFLVVATLIDIEHLIIPDELTKSFQLAAPILAVAVASNGQFSWNASDWLMGRDVFGQFHLNPWGFFAKVGGMSGVAIALLLISLPVARYVYSSFCPEAERWRDEDHRGFRWGVLWFVIVTVLHLAILAGLCAWVASPSKLAAHIAAPFGQAILGSLTGWGALYSVGLLGTVVFRKNAMGFGDVKFLAPIGAWLGPVGVVVAFFGAAVAGSLIGLPLYLMGGKRTIPFGPYLALGTVLALAFGPLLSRSLLAPLLGG
jgi:leader peptidase (prepilin peptidase) / N-methyltransferase